MSATISSLQRLAAHLHGRLPRPKGPVPSRAVLVEYVGRQSGAVVLLAGAAAIAYLAGHTAEVRPYAVMAAAVVPQVLLALVALGNDDRRRRLVASARPAWLLGGLAVVLAVTGMVTWLAGEPPLTPVAAVVAAAGLAVSAAPTSLAFAPRR